MKYIIFLGLLFLVTIVIAKSYTSKGSEKEKKRSTENGVSTIEYKVLAAQDGYEIRQYPELTVATTELNSHSYSDNSSTGFRKIASYIFGGNSTKEQIAMTSPVQMDMGTQPTMSFFMPGNVDPSELPIPNRNDVLVKVQQAKIVAVIEFSGWASDKILAQQFKLLKSKLEKESIAFEDTYSFLGYNPPYKLLHRKNEVIIPLKNYHNHSSTDKKQ